MLVPKYRIRWRYDWLDRAPKWGMWSLSTKNPEDQAWNKQKDNLMFASVEGKTPNGEIVTLCQVAGQDFCFFQWVAVASTPALSLVETGKKPFNPVTRLIGIKLVTRYENISVFDTGHIFREPRTQEDMEYNYAAFGR